MANKFIKTLRYYVRLAKKNKKQKQNRYFIELEKKNANYIGTFHRNHFFFIVSHLLSFFPCFILFYFIFFILPLSLSDHSLKTASPALSSGDKIHSIL